MGYANVNYVNTDIEQAFRFRPESGYGFPAKSPGITSEHEKAIGETFNDSMNRLFPNVGASMLTCTVYGQYAMYARNTLRTDGLNRPTLFTHSYVIPRTMYEQIMQSNPQMLLSIPMSSFADLMDTDTLDTLDLMEMDVSYADMDALWEKYRLGQNDRYAKLLMGAYEAICEKKNLKLLIRTEDQDIAEQTVRELTLCILEGLMPAMKSRITFSSGRDTQMRICVFNGSNRMTDTNLVFGVDDDHKTTIGTKDALRETFFLTLGRADRETREKILNEIDNWLSGYGIVDCTSLQLILAAFAKCRLTLTSKLRNGLFRVLVNAAGKTMRSEDVDVLLTDLARQILESGRVTPNEQSNVVEWYLGDCSETYREIAGQILTHPTSRRDVSAVLMKAVLDIPEAKNVQQILRVLCRTVPNNAPELEMETREKLAMWIIENDDKVLQLYGTEIISQYGTNQMFRLALDILGNARQKEEMTGIERDIVGQMLTRYSEEKQPMSEEQYELLDVNVLKYGPELQTKYIHYLFQVRLAGQKTDTARLELLHQLGKPSQELRTELEETLKNSVYRGLWELYQTKVLLPDEIGCKEIIQITRNQNEFKNPQGPFESRVAQLLISKYSADITTAPNILKKRESVVQAIHDLKWLSTTKETYELIENNIVISFWDSLTINDLFRNDGMLEHQINQITERVIRGNKEIVEKNKLLAACSKVKKDLRLSASLVECLLYDPYFRTDEVREDVREQLRSLIIRMLDEKHALSVDLLLLYGTMRETAVAYNDLFMKELTMLLSDLEGHLLTPARGKTEILAKESVILSDNQGLTEQLMKKLERDYGSQRINRELVRALEDRQNVKKSGFPSGGGAQRRSSTTAPAGSSRSRTQQPSAPGKFARDSGSARREDGQGTIGLRPKGGK